MTTPPLLRPISWEPGRRVLVVSDIHGNLPFLQGVLKKAGFSKEDVLIVLGDILEKSEGGLATLQYIMDLAQTHTVHAVLGNCENVTLGFLNDTWPTEIYRRYSRTWGEKCAWVAMAHRLGLPAEDPKDYPAARAAIEKGFARELAYLRAMPTILRSEDYLFVHGGVPGEESFEDLTIHGCTKNDNFLGQGHAFRRWVIVGHWPVTLYREDIPSAKPILLPERHIASIDGGCSLKLDGQLNALVLPERPGGEFSYFSYDGFPVATALEDQAPSPDPINIRWGHSELEVLAPGPEFSRCRHLESGRVLDILTDYLHQDDVGAHCEDSTDYRLPVRAGDRLSVVRQTSRGVLAKKDGVTGWYLGKLGEF